MQAKGGTGYSNISLILVYYSSSFDINYTADELKIRSIYGVNGKIVKNEQTQTWDPIWKQEMRKMYENCEFTPYLVLS